MPLRAIGNALAGQEPTPERLTTLGPQIFGVVAEHIQPAECSPNALPPLQHYVTIGCRGTKMKVALFLFALLALTGCAQNFVPNGSTSESFDSANGECYYRSQTVQNPYAVRNVYVLCMRQHGWVPEKG